MKFAMLASSSSGNCTVVQSGATTVLVDAGISARRTFHGLRDLALSEQIDAILISHEHSDHCKELGVVAKRFGCPIYSTKKTLAKLEPFLKGSEQLFELTKDQPMAFQDVEITAFPVSHDAVDPCGFTITDGRRNVGVCTDLGVMTEQVQHHLGNCDAISFEANHDVQMLENGRYPKYLQNRIRGRFGHLSNDEAGQGLAMLGMQGRLKHAILAHLSDHNNRPDLALKTVQHNLRSYSVELNVGLSHKSKPSQLIQL